MLLEVKNLCTKAMKNNKSELMVAKILGRVIRLNETGDSIQAASIINDSPKKRKISVAMIKTSQSMELTDDNRPKEKLSRIPIMANPIMQPIIALKTLLILSAPKTIP